MEKLTPVSEARAGLPKLIKEINKTKRHYVLTRNGKAAAILMSPEELETLEVLADREVLQSLIRAQEDVKAGRLISHEDVFGDA